MSKNLERSGKALLAAAFVAAMGFGATQAFADATETQPRDRCTDGCRALYVRCTWQGGTDCAALRDECLENCAL